MQTNLEMMENTVFEEKVDIDDLVLASKPSKLAEIESDGIKEEPIEERQAAFESDHDLGKTKKVKMEGNILKLCEELDKEKSVNSTMDFSLRRSVKIRQFVENFAQYDSVNHQMITEIVSLKTRIERIMNEHKIAMFQNTKTVNGIVKMHEEALENKSKELSDIKVTNQELLQKIQELETDKNNFASNDSSEKCPEIKPFSCKYCNKSFLQVHEVKEHIKVHNSISEVEDLNSELIGELEVKLKNLRRKIDSRSAKETYESIKGK